MNLEDYLAVINTIVQSIVACIAWKALNVWKKEIRGQDSYKKYKDLLEYIKNLRFLIFTANGNLHQIFLNDILVDGKDFYSDLGSIKDSKVFFHRNYLSLFNHINPRSDIFIHDKIRLMLNGLYPQHAKLVGVDKSKFNYLQLAIDDSSKIKDVEDGIYVIHPNEDLTFDQYFKKWELLIKELQRAIYQ